MLDTAANLKITRVGPGQPMGDLLRRYWQPVLLTEELGEPDGEPVPVRLLGEDLVAFRDTAGRVGVLDQHCAHRRASLLYGRNEACGLRCLYHGWKFDVTGQVVDMPNDAPDSQFKTRVRIKSYQVREAAGVIWVYMGPDQEAPPPLPAERWGTAGHFGASRVLLDCNFVQGMEGGIDSSHAGVLHESTVSESTSHPVHRSPLFGIESKDNAPRLEVAVEPTGLRCAAFRSVEGSSELYLRVTAYVFPNLISVPWPEGVPRMCNVFVPIDDQQTWVWYMWHDTQELDLPVLKAYSGLDDLTSDFHSPRNLANRHNQDRTRMRAGHFTGIRGISSEDGAMQESQGAIADRSAEHLCRADLAIVRLRRLLLERIDAFERLGSVELDGWDLPLEASQSLVTLISPDTSWKQLVGVG
jgi:phenylpropionate dioxygenase-like ring-hydroxylating dioxygenase large terminal subunit